MKERILAIVGAVALVAVAVVARSFLVGDDDGAGGEGGGSRPVVACTADLIAVCDALVEDGRIAEDPPTLDLGGERMTDQGIDGWITWDPAPDIANFDDEGAWSDTTAVATTTLAVATKDTTGLPEPCEVAALEWSCLAGAGPTTFALGIGSGTTSADLVRLYPVAISLVPQDGDATDVSANDLTRILDSPSGGQAPFVDQLRILRTVQGALTVIVGPKGALDGADDLSVLEPGPEATATVILATRPTASLDLAEALATPEVRTVLRTRGLTVDPDAELAPENRAGELYALRDKVG